MRLENFDPGPFVTKPRAFRGWFLPAIFALAGFTVVAARGPTFEQEEQVRAINSHFYVGQAALAPDGRHVAFVLRGDQGFELQIHDTAQPGKKTEARLAAAFLTKVDFLAWTSPDQLVLSGNYIQVVDVRTGRGRKLVDAEAFWKSRPVGEVPPQLRVLGFAAGDPQGLLLEVSIEARDGSVSLELHRLDLATGAHERKFSRQFAHPGGSLILDQQGRVRVIFARDTVPQRFFHLAPGETAGEKDLDRVLPDHTAFAFSVTPDNFLGERTVPLGFAGDPQQLYFATNRGRDTFALQAVDLRTGQRTGILAEDSAADLVDFASPWLGTPLVVDRARQTLAGLRINGGSDTRWIDPEIAAVHTTLLRDFPNRTVQIVEWDAARTRFLVLVSSANDPGRYFVHDRNTGWNTEYYAKLPGFVPDHRNPVRTVVMTAPTGGPLRLFLTVPRDVSATPPPLVVWLHDGPWARGSFDFNRDAQALATLGFAVLEPNYAGAGGEGRARRELIRRSPDRIPVEEVLAAVKLPVFHGTFDPARVVVVGEGYGGYLALRALQLAPHQFRGAVTINAVTDLADVWRVSSSAPASLSLGMSVRYEGDPEAVDAAAAAAAEAAVQRSVAMPFRQTDFEQEFARWMISGGPPLADSAVAAQAASLTQPVLFMHDPFIRSAPFASLKKLRTELKKLRRERPYFELSNRITRAELMLRVGEFVREHTDAP